MKSRSTARPALGRAKQRGVVLFFALIALVVMSLAAVALIRSVDTSTMIAGNLAFRQSAVSSADAGAETAIRWLAASQTNMNPRWDLKATPPLTGNVFNDPTYAFNNPALGYFTTFRANNQDFTNGTFDWSNNSVLVLPDPDVSGNTVRYVIERMCRLNVNSVLPTAYDCMLTQPNANGGAAAVKLPGTVCFGPGCPLQGQATQFRITVRVTGPKNTVSYIQTFVY
ncbi:MAG: hypothetical protein HOO95_00065 [Gallionella sp.]|nr:hypothetical protein [Gallionella sp.]